MSLSGLSDSINLGKKYPGYFTQWVFRGLVVAMVVLFVVALWSNGWRWSGEYSVCPMGDSPCVVPGYVLPVPPGTVVGDVPSWLALNADMLELLLVVLAFFLNHYLYVRRVEVLK